VVDGDDLLPGAQPQFSRADGQDDRRAQQGGLDMAVAVAVMPGQFVGVGQIGGHQTADRLFEIGHNARLVLDGGVEPTMKAETVPSKMWQRETQADSLSVISIRSGPVDRLTSMVSQHW